MFSEDMFAEEYASPTTGGNKLIQNQEKILNIFLNADSTLILSQLKSETKTKQLNNFFLFVCWLTYSTS